MKCYSAGLHNSSIERICNHTAYAALRPGVNDNVCIWQAVVIVRGGSEGLGHSCWSLSLSCSMLLLACSVPRQLQLVDGNKIAI